jgi:FkbM family methyltransferase
MTSIKSFLEKNNFTFVDIGAKGKIEYLKEFENFVSLYAFEPNPFEFELLKKKYLDTKFKFLEISPFALSDKKQISNFFITRKNSMSSFLQPDLANYQKHFGQYKEFESWQKNITQEKVIEVETETLDNYFDRKNITIDYLKIDTQGSELLILKGAKKLLENQKIKVIKLEVSLISVYKEQVLFAEVDSYLRSLGYILVDFVTYREDNFSIFNNSYKNKHFAPCGDAIYFLKEEDNSKEENTKIAIILAWLGYTSLSINICKSIKANELQIFELLKIKMQNQKSFPYRVLYNMLPPILFQFLKKIKQKTLSTN